MSAGNTMSRVYLAIKEEIMSGAFAPGDRLDPSRMTSELSASITPVREALYRLTGERIVESWQHEGFRVPLVTEAMLRDLYAWSLELVTVVVRSARKSRRTQLDRGGQVAPVEFGRLLFEIAAHSPNSEHRAALSNLNDRSQMLRAAEAAAVDDAGDLPVMASAIADGSWAQVQLVMTRYFRRRIRAVAAIAAHVPARQSA